MITQERGRIDYDECGARRTTVLVPGSCSTGVAWRRVVAAWKANSVAQLLGYGGTSERRAAADPSIAHEAEASERLKDAILTTTIDGAAHFMVTTHANEIARLIEDYVNRSERT